METSQEITKSINQYLHLYIGCEIETNIPGKLCGTFGHINMNIFTMGIEECSYILSQLKYNSEGDYYCRPVLRHLSSITEEDAKEICEEMEIIHTNPYEFVKEMLQKIRVVNFKMFVDFLNTLRRLSFDCDGLIESGIAVAERKFCKATKKKCEYICVMTDCYLLTNNQ